MKTSLTALLENDTSNRNLLKKTSQVASPNENIKLNTDHEKTLENSTNYRDGMDKWGSNDTIEWNRFVYTDGNKTRLVIGVNNGKLNDYSQLKNFVIKHQAKIVDTVSIKGEVKAAIVELLAASEASFAQEIRATGLSSYIEPNVKVEAQFVPNDPYWSVQWGPQKMEADWAWNTTVGSKNVLVAVIDTGIDYNHPDLAANYASLGYDWVNNDTDPLDDHGHGTHVAGIIAAALNNSIGMAGLAQVRVMAEKVLDSDGWGYSEWVAKGIIHATDCGANIISMSLGGYDDSELVHAAVKYAYNAGVLLVAAAGNDMSELKSYPAAYNEVIAVAATDQNDEKAWFSNWGDWIELAAPGVDIQSTVPWGYESWSGTSMACPHVSGLAALILSHYPEKSRDWVRIWLQYTADDLGDQGFDEYYGYGRINARKALEQTPPNHDLLVYKLETPPFVKPGNLEIINATVLDFGVSNETDITVQLFANDTLVDSKLLGFLAGGDSVTVNLSWNPTVEGTYNITLYIAPVLGETNLENNVLHEYTYVGFPIKAVVLRSAGNVAVEALTTWQTLNDEWHQFGDALIQVDYAALNKEDITYEDIVATEADVLIISCAYDPLMGWQFSDFEIEAIKRYVLEGHGLIVTGSTFYYRVPNNNKLAPLFGLNETSRWSTKLRDILYLQDPTHPLFRNIPNPFIYYNVPTAFPFDQKWDADEVVDGKYLAKGEFLRSAIVAYRGLVYISPWLEFTPPYYNVYHLQLFYNAITWSRYQKPQHELVASLQCPFHAKPGESILLNATVKNMGLNDETNVELVLRLNDIQLADLTVPTLASDQTATLSYVWASTEGVYNVTACVPPVTGEEEVLNNADTMLLRVSNAAVIGFIETHGESLHSGDLKTLYQNLGYTVNTIYFVLTPELLANYDVLIIGEAWPDFPWLQSEIEAIQNFINSGKGLVCVGDELEYSIQGILGEYGIWYNNHAGYSGSSTNFNHSHPTMEDVNYIYAPNPSKSLKTTFPGYWIANDTLNVYTLIAGAEVNGYILCMSDDFAAYVYQGNNEIMFTNIVDWMMGKHQHDLKVSLIVPAYLESDSTMLLNATVRNTGLSSETSAKLYLVINNTVVSSVTIPELRSGESYTINYSWTPVVLGSYNVTVYAPPLSEEEYKVNNARTKIVHVFFYSCLYLPHEWIGDGSPIYWNTPYTLPFDFQFYGNHYRTLYISSRGLLTFTGPDDSSSNGVAALAEKLAIAPAWDDWITTQSSNIYIWANSTHVGIRWHVAANYNSSVLADFEAILRFDGSIQFNYGQCDGSASATIGISNGAGHVMAEDSADISYSSTLVFLPFNVGWARDVAITNVAFSSNVAYQGTVRIKVTVANFGNMTENFALTGYCDNTVIATQNIQWLAPNSTLTLIFTWNTADISLYINHTIWAKTSKVIGDINTDNNFSVGGVILVRILGDVNGDKKVEGKDMALAAKAFATYPGHLRWNPQADLNGDSKIDGKDVAYIAKNYGRTYTEGSVLKLNPSFKRVGEEGQPIPTQPVTFSIEVENAHHLFCWQVVLYYNSDVLYTQSSWMWVPSNHVFSYTSEYELFGPVTGSDSYGEYVMMFVSLHGGETTFTGSGVLCKINFTAVGTGTSYLNFSKGEYGLGIGSIRGTYETFFYDSELNYIPATSVEGRVEVKGVTALTETSTRMASVNTSASCLIDNLFMVNVVYFGKRAYQYRRLRVLRF